MNVGQPPQLESVDDIRAAFPDEQNDVVKHVVVPECTPAWLESGIRTAREYLAEHPVHKRMYVVLPSGRPLARVVVDITTGEMRCHVTKTAAEETGLSRPLSRQQRRKVERVAAKDRIRAARKAGAK